MANLDDTDVAKRAASQDMGLNPEDYAAFNARQKAPNDQITADAAGPAEHKQFVSEVTSRNPVEGAAVTLAAPVYSAAKALGINVGDDKSSKTSAASWDEIFSAGEGFVGGLKRFMKGK